MTIATTNPATGEVVKSFEPLTGTQIEQKLQRAASAFRAHRRTSFAERASKMMRAAEILEKEKDECAHLMTLEMGKPLKAAVAEALKSATGCRYYAQNAEKFLADQIVETGAKRSFILYLPLTGGHPLDGAGNFYAPAVLTDMPKDSPAYNEELFGPVASIFRVKDVDQAIQIANDSRFGLGASAWTNDPTETERFINELDVGMVSLNKMVASDPRLPFGGVKFSGHGRELAEHGIREFVNIKTVWIQ